jgi:hypothetical protein
VTAEMFTLLRGKKKEGFLVLHNARISWEVSSRGWDTSTSEIWSTGMWRPKIFFFWQTPTSLLAIVQRYVIWVFVDRTTTTWVLFAGLLHTWHLKSSERAYMITRWMFGRSECSCFECSSEIFHSKVLPFLFRY